MNPIEWLKGEGRVQGFLRDLLFVAVVVGVISVVSQIALGVWTPMVAVESGSMDPNMKVGDIIIIQGISRTDVVTWEEGEKTGYQTFKNPGDVVLYRPYGKEKLGLLDQVAHLFGKPYPPDKATPIIHRAMQWVEVGQPMWPDGPLAPFSGYITKGDNNDDIDQRAGGFLTNSRTGEVLTLNKTYFEEELTKGDITELDNGTYLDRRTGLPLVELNNDVYVISGINYLMPVRQDWVIGTARFRIPLVGYIRLLPSIIGNQIRELLT